MSAAVLPQVGGSSPSAAAAGHLSGAGRVLKLPSIISGDEGSSSASSADGSCEIGADHAAFIAMFGSMASARTTDTSFVDMAGTVLSNFRFFQDLDYGVKAKLPSVMTSMSKKIGSVLFRQGDPPGNCYIVLSGAAAIYVKSEDEFAVEAASPQASLVSGIRTVEGFSLYNEESKFGKQIGVLGPGTLVGELALINDQPRSASIKCIEDTEMLVIRRSDFDNILKEEMVRKGDEKLRFLMAHVPGMRDVPVPKSGTKQPHASYFFKKLTFKRGHRFFQEGTVAEPSIIVLYKGSVESRRSELALPGMGSPLPSSSSTPALREDPLPGGAKLGNYRRTPDMISRSNYQARMKSHAREQELDETVNRLGVLMPGSVFSSLPFQEKEPFTVSVTSQQCEVFVCSGQDYMKLPRKLLDIILEYTAHAAAWRLKCHHHIQDFRRSRPVGADQLAKKRQPLIRIKSSPAV